MQPTNRSFCVNDDFVLYLVLAADFVALAYTMLLFSFTAALVFAPILVAGAIYSLVIPWVLTSRIAERFKKHAVAVLTKCGEWWKNVLHAQRHAEVIKEQNRELKRKSSLARALANKYAACNAELCAMKYERDYKLEQLKHKTSSARALATRFAACNAELCAANEEIVAKDAVIAAQRSEIADAKRTVFDKSSTILVLTHDLEESKALHKDFRFHLELQRTSAKTATEHAASLQNEVHLLRAFMTNRLGLDCSTVPAATGNGRGRGGSLTTVSGGSSSTDSRSDSSDNSSDDVGIVHQAVEASSVAVHKASRKPSKSNRRRSWKNRVF
eukprot:g11497.t1